MTVTGRHLKLPAQGVTRDDIRSQFHKNRGNVPRYVIVSPVKDEERFVKLTLDSVVAQTIRPVAWLIMDDGSTDGTVDIISRYTREYEFIRCVPSQSSRGRQTGSAEIRAFTRGYAQLAGVDHDFVVKLDGDVSFGSDYFERLFAEFCHDQTLGIASGVYLEQNLMGSWTVVSMPSYHAFGACKVVRRMCYEQIGGFDLVPGWDTADEIRAISVGWTTRHFSEFPVKHHRKEGTGMGLLQTSMMHGRIHYVTAGDPLFFVLKCIRRMASWPIVLSGVALALGYLASAVTAQPRIVNSNEAQAYNRLLRARMLESFSRVVKKVMPS